MKLRWTVTGVAGLAVFVLCVVELGRYEFDQSDAAAKYGLAVLLGAAILFCRQWPSVSLGIAWLAGIVHAAGQVGLLLSDGVLLIVLFASARWGNRLTVLAGALTTLFGPLIAYLSLQGRGIYYKGYGGRLLSDLVVSTGAEIHARSLAAVSLGVLGVPWLLGLTLRFMARAESAQQATLVAEASATQAHEIARLQEEQTRLARDVHDVVGHSLAVILAQAESAQYLDEPEAVQRTMRNIASSARSSLRDVRAVLTSTHEAPRGVDELIEGVRQSGRTVEVERTGRVQPLPPELTVVAYRVLQEMLTNAIKHGASEHPITVSQVWPEPDHPAFFLRLSVTNPVGPPSSLPPGVGLSGMQRRLDSVGGHLQFGRSGETFTTSAWIPVRPTTEGFPL